QELLEVFFLIQDSGSVYREGQGRGLPIGPLRAPEELFDDEHLIERKFFETVEMHDGSSVLFPGTPYRFSGGNGVPTRPPLLGEHTEEVLSHE
ncbi:MAG: CoA transferase, partial [Rhodococcus sp. (in: high G+C Gram-positive bacteria)]|uniref:CoA transferase n=1 Tax=Rhodococcus sp. TaxID=1831 RepID=UPI003BAF6AF5